MAFAVEPIISVIHLLIEQLRGARKARRAMFDRVFEPVFNQLLAVHGDFIKTCVSTKLLLPGFSPDGSWKAPGSEGESAEGSVEFVQRIDAAKDEIARKRLDFQPVRAEIIALAKELDRQKLPDEERHFIPALIEYFPSVDTDSPNAGIASLLASLATIRDPREIASLLQHAIEQHQIRWSDLCVAFAAAIQT
jgi:hypothetical protein